MHSGKPDGPPNPLKPLEPLEPLRLAQAAATMGLSRVVVTSVDRDDLPDRGANHFAATIRALKARLPESHVEVLTADFLGVEEVGRQHLDVDSSLVLAEQSDSTAVIAVDPTSRTTRESPRAPVRGGRLERLERLLERVGGPSGLPGGARPGAGVAEDLEHWRSPHSAMFHVLLADGDEARALEEHPLHPRSARGAFIHGGRRGGRRDPQ